MTTASQCAWSRDGEPIEVALEPDPSTLLLSAVHAPPARVPVKIRPAELRVVVSETGMVAERAVAERFGVAKVTARTALEATPGLDLFSDAKLSDRYLVTVSEVAA